MKSLRLPLFIIMITILAASGRNSADASPKPMSTNAASGKDPYLQPLRHETPEDAFTKLGRGLTNIVEGPFELYAQPALVPQENDIVYAFSTGLTKGLAMFVIREFVGVYDIATFPIPLPKNYQPLIEPATTFTDFSRRRSIAQS